MDPLPLVLYCRFKDDRVPITLHKHMCFADVLRVVCDRFKLSMDSVSLNYLGVRDESCFLRSDEEMNDMVSLFSISGNRLVEVIVSDCSGIACGVDGSIGSSIVTDDSEYCDVESSTSRKVYKSDAWAGYITGVGQVFEGGASEFRDALRKYCIKSGRVTFFEKNCIQKVTAFCRERGTMGCGWGIVASYKSTDKKFMIRKYEAEHTCEKLSLTDPNKELNSALIAGLIRDEVKDNPSIRPSAIVSRLRNEYGLHVSYYKAWNAGQKANGLHIGDVSESYKQLERYIEALHETNPGSIATLELDDDGGLSKRFKRLFLAFGGCIAGLKHIRPLLFIDGTFLKGKYKGTLLSAVGKNGNRGLFPLAFGIVDAENLVNWQWFLENLRVIVGNERQVTFFSDRHVGLLEGMSRVFPDSVHCYCLQHLKDNLKTRFSGGDVFFAKKRENLVTLLEKCAVAPTVALLEQNMKQLLAEGGKKMKHFIDSMELNKWTEAHCTVCRYGETTSNGVESFNSWASDIRYLPLTQMVDKLRLKLMKWFDERRSKSAKWKGFLCEYYEDLWETSLHNSLSWDVSRANPLKYEVFSEPSHSVDFMRKECSCYLWQRNGFPCCHAITCIVRYKLDVKQYVEDCFYAETYRKSYAVSINPVPTAIWCDSGLINESKILPPITKRPPGRPKNKRIPSKGESVGNKRTAVRCGRCNKFGNHNKRTCKEAI